MSRTDDVYRPALAGKKIPILTLDNKWHRLFTQVDSNPQIRELEEELNELLKRQGKVNTETKDIKKIKNRLMDEIVSMMDDNGDEEVDRKVAENKRLIAECNDKLEAYQDEILDLPKEINEVNKRLMLVCMDVCYAEIKENTQEIEEISEWITEIRIELKKKVIRKQEKQIKNQELYAYMHDIFGADVIELFDMKYNPEEQKVSRKPEGKEKGKETS